MNERDIFYRAFHEYKKQTSEDKNIKRQCDQIISSPNDEDSLEMVRTYCVIEEDWILILEKGMDYVEKAIAEERQFIRKQGEVVPIEKIRHVSVDTVTHLARHSELITKEPEEDQTLTPEKLFMSENLSDFAVYENRFLYMLLCYARDFIGERLDKIIEFGRTFKMKGKVSKRVKTGKKSLVFLSELSFEDKNDPLSQTFSASTALIERIETMQRYVVALLNTPLMREVSKAPMIKPPITRTNVLRMNVNFRMALEMYCQLAEYDKPGYSIEKIKSTMRPFSDALIEEQSQIISLQQFLYYKYANKLSDSLWENYQAEEKKRKDEDKIRLKKQAEALKKKIKETGAGYEEYVVVLEKQLEGYETNLNELILARQKIDNLNGKVEQLEGNVMAAQAKCADLTAEVAVKEQEKIALIQQNNEKISQIEAQYNVDLKAATDEYQKQKEQAQEQIRQEKDKNVILKAQLHGIRNQHGLITDEEDFTSKERFLELEAEFDAFEKLLKKQWGYTKKRIRRDILRRK